MHPRDDTRRPALRTALAACTLGLITCAPEAPDAEDPFVPMYESERLRIGTTFDHELCLGVMDMWEDHLDVIEQTLGLSRDFAWLFLYLNGEEQQLTADCGWGDRPFWYTGCWSDSVVRGTFVAIPHELVHAWTATVQPSSLPILQEGIAVRMTGDVQRIASQQPFTVDDLLLLELPTGRYPDAGHLVAWLLAAYGAETFMTLYTRTSRGMTEAQISAAFLDVLGKAPKDVLLAYETFAKAYYPAMGGAACGQAPVIPWRGEAATWPAEGSCSEGPWFGGNWQRVAIEISTPGTYLFDPGDRLASLTRCLTEPADEFELPNLPARVSGDWWYGEPLGGPNYAYEGPGEWGDEPLELEAGTYEVWVNHSYQLPPELNSDMSLRRL